MELGPGYAAAATVATCDTERAALADDMIDVHGAGAAAVARENARTAALAGQGAQAKSWIAVLGLIQSRLRASNARAHLMNPYQMTRILSTAFGADIERDGIRDGR